jgi:hypothetical protein
MQKLFVDHHEINLNGAYNLYAKEFDNRLSIQKKLGEKNDLLKMILQCDDIENVKKMIETHLENDF